MNNLLFGLQALGSLIGVEASLLFFSPVIRGFLAGYLVASLVFGFLAAGAARRRREEEARRRKKKKS